MINIGGLEFPDGITYNSTDKYVIDAAMTPMIGWEFHSPTIAPMTLLFQVENLSDAAKMAFDWFESRGHFKLLENWKPPEMKYKVFLTIPSGNDIAATISAVREFFESNGEKHRDTVAKCLGIHVPIPHRLVQDELNALAESALDQLVYPGDWINKEIEICFDNNDEVITLDGMRKPATTGVLAK